MYLAVHLLVGILYVAHLNTLVAVQHTLHIVILKTLAIIIAEVGMTIIVYSIVAHLLQVVALVHLEPDMEIIAITIRHIIMTMIIVHLILRNIMVNVINCHRRIK